MGTGDNIVIVGSGLAGVTAAGTLREAGHAGRIVMLGDEYEPPYDRPPLSKGVLVHDEFESLVAEHLPTDIALRAPDSIALRPAGWFEENRIEMRLGRRATRLLPAEHQVVLEGGEHVHYDRLLLAPGARVRQLPAIERGRVPHSYLRTLRDAIRLREQLRPGRHIVLLGGGVIGMEVAASAALRDCQVTVIELAPRIMSRALAPAISDFVAKRHLAQGVDLRLETGAVGQAADGAPGLEISCGETLAADLIVIGIGVVPNVELADGAGLACQDGIVVDEFGATSALDVYAAGDAVSYPDSFHGRRLRSENWMHAQNQAAVVARNLLGAREPYRQVPHMWSDQYDLKIQVTGRHDTDEQILRGDPAKGRFIAFHLSEGRLVGASGINEARDMKFTQRLLEAGTHVPAAQLADPGFNLKKAAG